MASYHVNNKVSRKSLLNNIGNKIKTVAEVASAVKRIFDVGRMLYNGVRAIGPAAASVGLLL